MHTQPVEDIHAIVNRFEAWSGRQTAVSQKDEVRELTYEEAIRASRSRFVVNEPVMPPMPAASIESQKLKDEDPKRPRQRAVTHSKQRTKARQGIHRRVNPPAVKEEPAFRQVLSESLVPSPSPEITPRQAALTIRVSAQEQALIKARAVEANLSISAYLRQCALEVEQLRMQLQQMSAVRQPMLIVPESSAMPVSRFLTRLTRWFFSRWTSTLAVRS